MGTVSFRPHYRSECSARDEETEMIAAPHTSREQAGLFKN